MIVLYKIVLFISVYWFVGVWVFVCVCCRDVILSKGCYTWRHKRMLKCLAAAVEDKQREVKGELCNSFGLIYLNITGSESLWWFYYTFWFDWSWFRLNLAHLGGEREHASFCRRPATQSRGSLGSREVTNCFTALQTHKHGTGSI